MTDPCKPQACAIQSMFLLQLNTIFNASHTLVKLTQLRPIDCLTASGYDESKCTKIIDELYSCCLKFYSEKGEDARTPCCPIPRLLKFKVQQREKEKLDAQLVRH